MNEVKPSSEALKAKLIVENLADELDMPGFTMRTNHEADIIELPDPSFFEDVAEVVQAKVNQEHTELQDLFTPPASRMPTVQKQVEHKIPALPLFDQKLLSEQLFIKLQKVETERNKADFPNRINTESTSRREKDSKEEIKSTHPTDRNTNERSDDSESLTQL